MTIRTCRTLLCLINNSFSKSINNGHHSNFVFTNRKFTSWDIVGSLCLERKPVITQALTPLEQKYLCYLQRLEIQKSYLSEHEKKHMEDLRIAEKLWKNELENMDEIPKQTAQDLEDLWDQDLSKFQPNARETDADKKNDRHSLRRKLDSSLVLVVNHKLGNDHRWILPQIIHEDGETLRQTAERAFSEICVTVPKLQVMGNAPVGYYKYKYPKAARGNGTCGAKVFFYKAQLLDKNLESLEFKQNDLTSDVMWLTHSELNDILQPCYARAVRSFLYPDVADIEFNSVSQYSSQEEDEPIAKTSVMN